MSVTLRWLAPLAVVLAVVAALAFDHMRTGRVTPEKPLTTSFSPADPPAPPRDPTLRDPFVTGAAWRAALRGDAPSPAPSAKAAAPPPAPPVLIGTLVKGGRRFAVTPGAIVGAGDRLGAYVVRGVELDRVVLELDGRTLVIVPSSAEAASVPPSPASTGR
jgi:hypothetical protein